jgi:hypothetical protein
VPPLPPKELHRLKALPLKEPQPTPPLLKVQQANPLLPLKAHHLPMGHHLLTALLLLTAHHLPKALLPLKVLLPLKALLPPKVLLPLKVLHQLKVLHLPMVRTSLEALTLPQSLTDNNEIN